MASSTIKFLNNKATVVGAQIDPNSTITLYHSASVLIFSDRGGLWTEGSGSRTLSEIASSPYVTVTRSDAHTLTITSNIAYATKIVAIGDGYITIS